MSFQLSQGQESAKTMVGAFLGQTEHMVAIITGYAGTGKTTLIKVLEKEFDTPIVLTPTGKAALRVTEATGLSACTIHRFIYKAEDDPKSGEPKFVLKSIWDISDEIEGRLILVDEASMVDPKVWIDLLSLSKVAHFRILLMGDRFQLPPVNKDKDGKAFCALDVKTPFSVNLTEVIRQAQDNPIIAASMDLRSGKPEFVAMKRLSPIAASKIVENVLRLREAGGATLVHRNVTRHKINADVRAALGYPADEIKTGEPLLVLQNNYGVERYNGEVVRFDGWEVRPSDNTTEVVRDNYSNSALEMSFGVGGVEGARCMLSPEEIIGKAEINKIGNWSIRRHSKDIFKSQLRYDDEERVPPHLHANYGYALTTHKSQGSEWPEVLVVCEPSLQAMPEIERKRWLYTAITRAKEKVSFVYLKS